MLPPAVTYKCTTLARHMLVYICTDTSLRADRPLAPANILRAVRAGLTATPHHERGGISTSCLGTAYCSQAAQRLQRRPTDWAPPTLPTLPTRRVGCYCVRCVVVESRCAEPASRPLFSSSTDPAHTAQVLCSIHREGQVVTIRIHSTYRVFGAGVPEPNVPGGSCTCKPGKQNPTVRTVLRPDHSTASGYMMHCPTTYTWVGGS